MTSKIPIYLGYQSIQPGARQKSARLAYPPLALGLIVSYALSLDEVRERYRVVPRILTDEVAARETFDEYGAGVYLFSNYMWSTRGNLAISRLVKQLDRRSVTVHGGPNTPKYEQACADFFGEHDHVDITVRHEGELTVGELLSTLPPTLEGATLDEDALASVLGITFRASDGRAPVRTADRERLKELDRIPSPYLNGFFDGFNVEEWVSAIQETNRGCPYGCTFCDWGSATLQKIYLFSMDRVRDEIEWIAKKKVPHLFMADANFGMFDREVEIAEMYVRAHEKYGYPKQVEVNYAKNATLRLAEIVSVLHRGGLTTTGNLAIQTHDPVTLKNIARANIKTERYDELLGIFRKQRLHISSDLMIGLPGQTVESFKKDLQFFIHRRVFSSARRAVVLPNSPMGDPEYMQKFGIKIDRHSSVVETASLPTNDMETVLRLNGCYQAFFGCAMLKYVLYWMQIEHGVQAYDVLGDIAEHPEESLSEMPFAAKFLFDYGPHLQMFLDIRKKVVEQTTEAMWRQFYQELIAYLVAHYGVERDSALDALVEAEMALMPRADRTFPCRVELPHDVIAYFEQFRDVGNFELFEFAPPHRPLRDFDRGELVVTDPGGLCSITSGTVYLNDTLAVQWELSSALMDRPIATPATAQAETIRDRAHRALPLVR